MHSFFDGLFFCAYLFCRLDQEAKFTEMNKVLIVRQFAKDTHVIRSRSRD